MDIPDFILLNVGYAEPNANWNWKKVYSPFARIYYVTKGTAHTYIDGVRHTLKPGYLYLTPPFTLHDDESDNVFQLYYIHFYEKVINKESIFERFQFPVELKASELDINLINRLLNINPERYLREIDPQLYDNPPAFSQYIADSNKTPRHHTLETKGILCLLLSKFLESATNKSDNHDSRIKKVLKHIHENSDKDLSVKELATIACISEDHLTRLFKKAVGATPISYINSKKIEKAQLLLLTTNMAIQNIALELSIDNISYFNRMFKLQTGTTPMKYRETYRSN